MNDETALSRRRLLRGVVAGAGVGLLSGCDALSHAPLLYNKVMVM